ncbi:MAG: hypothetical protein COS84_07550 [Armatimonadetes bacterium CG07_land_8_20_14_0_80_40_9]|nr:MAG: hypothetical protein COS84_07550 [Armatimonadetes bacterium CG07_land_8_20_14_0_80_40_9]
MKKNTLLIVFFFCLVLLSTFNYVTSKPNIEPIDFAPLIMAGTLPAETHIDAGDRERIYLSGTWQFQFDDADVGIKEKWYSPQLPRKEWTGISVPGTWDLGHPQGFNRQTISWYAYRFTPPEIGSFVRLRFEGVFREAKVWLNGKELGEFDLPYLPFGFDVTKSLRLNQSNILVVRVDNRLTENTLPADTTFNPKRHGWFPYGGITRPVYLEGGLEAYVAQTRIITSTEGEFHSDVFIQQDHDNKQTVEAYAWITYKEKKVFSWKPIDINHLKTALRFKGKVFPPQLWSPRHPEHLYRFHLRLTNVKGKAETVAYDFAFRSFEAKDGCFYLNGKDTFLKGVNRHEDHPEYGPVYNETVMKKDIALLGKLQVNFTRPGHYPNDVRVLKALEKEGIMLAEEIPVYQLNGRQMANSVLIERAQHALQLMIVRDYNRPGIVIWSVANEIHNWERAAPKFIQILYDTAKLLDPSRPVMVAALTIPFLSRMDISSGKVDVIGINEYFGWYVGKTTEAMDYLKKIQSRFPDKTLIISEYGAGALLGRHIKKEPGEEPVNNHSYSEEFQVFFHRQHLQQFAQLPFIRGVMPWVLADFRMQWTPHTGKPHPVKLMNLKGLLSDKRIPKAVFNLIAETYQRWSSLE